MGQRPGPTTMGAGSPLRFSGRRRAQGRFGPDGIGCAVATESSMPEFVRQFVVLVMLVCAKLMGQLVLFFLAEKSAEYVPNRAQDTFAFQAGVFLALVYLLFQFPFGFMRIRHDCLLSKQRRRKRRYTGRK